MNEEGYRRLNGERLQKKQSGGRVIIEQVHGSYRPGQSYGLNLVGASVSYLLSPFSMADN